MNDLNDLLPIPIFVITIITVAIIAKFSKPILLPQKYKTLDGIRGYFAIFIVIDHASIWYSYLRTGTWESPPSSVYLSVGYIGLCCFFMISSFLFFSKLIDGRSKPFDWIHFYVSRIMRITPLYLFVMINFILIIAILSGFSLHEPLPSVLNEVMQWVTFTIVGFPDINGIDDPGLIVAGVTWTLIFEWIFYFSLPLFALIFFRSKSPAIVIILTCAIAIWIVTRQELMLFFMLSFVSGMVCAFLARSEKFCVFAVKDISTVFVLICLVCSIVLFSVPPLILITILFAFIACGNTLFGLLTARISRLLGQMTYGIYLLHGMVFFVVFRFIIGFSDAGKISVVQHWEVISACIAPLILICYAVHIYIELPAIHITYNIAAAIKSRFSARPKALPE